MKKLSVYLDTSVIGGCFDPEFEQWSNGLVHDFYNGTFVPVVSSVTALEIEPAPDTVKEKFNEILELHHIFLKPNDESKFILKKYLERVIVPLNYSDDALHIALATVNDIDTLVSWNFKHIVHLDKIKKFNAINLENGYKTIDIYSPREVTIYGAD